MKKLLLFAYVIVLVFGVVDIINAEPFGKVIVSGDEWTLSNQAFLINTTETGDFATNVANFIDGMKYLILQNAQGTIPYDSSFQAILTSLGKTVTINPSDPFSSSLLSQYSAVFLAGTIGSGAGNAPILNQYVQAGGSVYLSLATGNFGSAALEANAWNPFLNNWGLNAGSVWFPNTTVQNIPTVPSSHPLNNNVSALTWGYGQQISVLNSANPSTEIAISGDFGPSFGQLGMMGVSAVANPVPEPISILIFSTGLVGVGGYLRRKLKN